VTRKASGVRAETLSLTFGALANQIRDQLRSQGFPVTAARARAFQDVADAITLLAIHGYITDAGKVNAHRKLFARIKTLVAAQGRK
jgi:hypothetical protein